MPRHITVDFFRVQMPAPQPTFDHLLQQVSNSPNDAARNVNWRDDVLRMHSCARSNQIWEGELTRIRLNDLPHRASLDGVIQDLGLEVDEGLGEQTAFLYHVPTQVLLIQRNRHGVSASALAYYLGARFAIPDAILLDFVMEADAVQRLANFREVTKFRVRFARVNNASVFRQDANESLDEMIDVLEHFQAPTADIAVSMGRRRGSLAVEAVKSAARRLMRFPQQQHREQVKHIEVRGVNEHGEPDGLDLVKHKMFEMERVHGEARRLPYESRRDALQRALGAREAELRQMFQ